MIIILGNVNIGLLGDTSLRMEDYVRLFRQAAAFVLECYSRSGAETLTEARQNAWKSKMAKALTAPPELCTLPPTDESFQQNVLRAHLQMAIWRNATNPDPPDLDPVHHGWHRKDGTLELLPTVVAEGVPLVPDELLALVKCGCKSPTRACTPKSKCKCQTSALLCTLFCACTTNHVCHNSQ